MPGRAGERLPAPCSGCAWAGRPLTFRKISASEARGRNKKIFLFKGQSRRLLKRCFQIALLTGFTQINGNQGRRWVVRGHRDHKRARCAWWQRLCSTYSDSIVEGLRGDLVAQQSLGTSADEGRCWGSESGQHHEDKGHGLRAEAVRAERGHGTARNTGSARGPA